VEPELIFSRKASVIFETFFE